MTEQALVCDGERPLSLVPLPPYSIAVPALIYCAFLENFLCCGKHFNNLNWNIKSLTWGCLQKASRLLDRQFFFYVMQKSKLRLVARLFSHEVHSMIRLRKSSMLEHWKTLQEDWVNALDTLYELFLMLGNLLCKGESLNKYNRFSQLQKNRIYHMVQIKRIFLTEKVLICLINKSSFIFLTQSK